MREINLKLPIPPSVNNYWRSAVIAGRNRVYLTEAAKFYKNEVWILSRGVDPFDGPVVLELFVFRPRKSGDLDNYMKALLDALTGIVYHDDEQVVEIHAHRLDDKLNPRVLVVARDKDD